MLTTILELMSKKWALFIIRSLMGNGKLRYSELMHELDGVSPKTLTERLREMEREGIIKREMFPEIPPKVEYSLTRKGRELGKSIGYITEWVGKWYPDAVPTCSKPETNKMRTRYMDVSM
jgi:DNA-binding HxlR family transcriptional regulator